MTLSVVVPVCNEQDNIPVLYERLLQVFKDLHEDFELIYVDDGSTDATAQKIQAIHERDGRVKMLSLSRNFGHQMALTAGMDYAEGDAVIVMDGDLQHPPEIIKDLVARWKNGFDIVYTIRQPDEKENAAKRIISKLFYSIFRRLTVIDLPSNTADFRLLDRKVVQAFRTIRERVRFLRGLTNWVGFRSTSIVYHAQPRQSGRTKYTFLRMIRLAVDAIVSFSALPIYFAIFAGLFLAVFGFAYALYALYVRLVTHHVVPGWTSLLMLLSLVGGIQLIVLGVMGIYLGKMYEEIKQRPLYLIRQTLGLTPRS